MSKEEEKRDECTMNQTDFQGNTNLCCCYVVNPDGEYEAPCYSPVKECR